MCKRLFGGHPYAGKAERGQEWEGRTFRCDVDLLPVIRLREMRSCEEDEPQNGSTIFRKLGQADGSGPHRIAHEKCLPLGRDGLALVAVP